MAAMLPVVLTQNVAKKYFDWFVYNQFRKMNYTEFHVNTY